MCSNQNTHVIWDRGSTLEGKRAEYIVHHFQIYWGGPLELDCESNPSSSNLDQEDCLNLSNQVQGLSFRIQPKLPFILLYIVQKWHQIFGTIQGNQIKVVGGVIFNMEVHFHHSKLGNHQVQWLHIWRPNYESNCKMRAQL